MNSGFFVGPTSFLLPNFENAAYILIVLLTDNVLVLRSEPFSFVMVPSYPGDQLSFSKF